MESGISPHALGLVPYWWSKPLKELRITTFNARVETVTTKPVFRDAFTQWNFLELSVLIVGNGRHANALLTVPSVASAGTRVEGYDRQILLQRVWRRFRKFSSFPSEPSKGTN
jgi:hypothetical protein